MTTARAHPTFRVTVGLALLLSASVTVSAGAEGVLAAPAGLGRARVQQQPRRKVRFAVLGDLGAGTSAQLAVARRMCRWQKSHPFRVIVTTGDNVYPDGSRRLFRSRFFRPYRCLRRRGVRFRATLGNHDYLTRRGRPELREPRFGFEGRNYTFKRKSVRFVMVDSNDLRRRWLARASRPRGSRWTVVVFHHPVVSPGLHGPTPALKRTLPRLFRRRGVDLVLNGHDHLYALSRRRRVHYLVTGGGGAPLYSCQPQRPSAICRERHHFVYVVAGRERMRVRGVPISGRPFGRFSLEGLS